MHAAEYIAQIVEPTVMDLEANPTSVRHAFLACVVTFHCIDYMADEKSAAQLRQEFRDASTDFAAVDRIAHAFKHMRTGHEESKHIQPLEAAAVMSRPPAFLDHFVLDVSRLDDPVGGVTIKGETTVDVLDTVKRALAFLRGKLIVG